MPGGLHRIELVVNRRRRAGQIADLAHLHMERERDVVAHGLEKGISDQMHNVR
jgi:hypothetical protein